MKRSTRRLSFVVSLIACGGSVHAQPQTIQEVRAGFATQPRQNPNYEVAPVQDPPPGCGLEKVTYDGPVGPLLAYATPPADDGERHPAVVWVKGGFGGIGSWLWEPSDPTDDQSVRPFLDANAAKTSIIVVCPSFRGENENPGQFEMFLGEVDDLAAAVEYTAARPDVDPGRILVVGHSTGGTLALLLAEATDRPAGIVCFGGAPDFARVVRNGGYGVEPFDPANSEEVRMRSPITFAATLRTPVLFVEGERSSYSTDALRMASAAQQAAASMEVALVPGADHFSVLRPINTLLATRLLSTELSPLPTPDEIYAAYGRSQASLRDERFALIAASTGEQALSRYADAPIQVTESAVALLRPLLAESSGDSLAFVRIFVYDTGDEIDWNWKIVDNAADAHIQETNGIALAVEPIGIGLLAGKVLDSAEEGDGLVLRTP